MTLERDDADERLARLDKLMREARGKTAGDARKVAGAEPSKRPAPVKVEGAQPTVRARPRPKKR